MMDRDDFEEKKPFKLSDYVTYNGRGVYVIPEDYVKEFIEQIRRHVKKKYNRVTVTELNQDIMELAGDL